MTFDTAYKINSAAVWIGFALIGVRSEIDPHHIETIRGVSLAQMQTATEVVEAANDAAIKRAENEAVSSTKIHCICDARLLAQVKLYADAFQEGQR